MRQIGAMVVWAGGQTTQKLLEAMKNMYCTAVLGTTSFDLYVPTACKEVLGVEAKELGVKKVLGGGEAGLGRSRFGERSGNRGDAIRSGNHGAGRRYAGHVGGV